MSKIAPGKYVLIHEAQAEKMRQLDPMPYVVMDPLATAIPLEALVVPENCVLVFSGGNLTCEEVDQLHKSLKGGSIEGLVLYLPESNLKALSLEDCEVLRNYLDARLKGEKK